MAAEAGRHRAVEGVDPELDPGDQVIHLADPQEVARQSLAGPAELAGGVADHLVHLRLLRPQRATDGDPVAAAVGDDLRGGAAQVLIDAALHDPVHQLAPRTPLCPPTRRAGLGPPTRGATLGHLVRGPVPGRKGGPVLGVPGQAARQPPVGALSGALGVVAIDVERGALVEHERDVRAQRGLHRHRALRREEPLAPIHVGAEAHPLLLDREDRPGLAAGGRDLDPEGRGLDPEGRALISSATVPWPIEKT